jgi:predicted phage tail protein
LSPNIKIKGASGSDASQPRYAIEVSDSLRSRAFLRIIDLICEGEIEGLALGPQSIFLNETPLFNPNGSYNFAGVQVTTKRGTQNQEYVPGFSSVENEVAVGLELKAGLAGSLVRQVNDPNVNRLKIRISVPQLTQQNVSNGDITGTAVNFHVDVQPSGGSYTTVSTRTITGKSSSKYEVTQSIDLPGSAPWNIRVVRDSADSTSSALQNRTTFESYTEVIDVKLRYPNSAYAALKIDSAQFGQVPSRAYDLKLLKIQIPSNYNYSTTQFSGTWDGTFITAWSDNPAWCFYNLVTNARWGLGNFIDASQVDIWALYTIGNYCNQLVSDGFGGYEKRFTCNTLIANRADAYTMLQSMASVFRGMTYWAAGSVTAVQDSPSDPGYLYTPSNVVDGKFNYASASAKVRHSVALIAWNDPKDFYRQKIEYVEDQDAIARIGVIETQVTAFGCTSRGQAHRLGKWLLYTEQNESEVLTFRTGLDGLISRPGQMVQVADPVRAGARMGGRIHAATLNTVTIDSDYSGSTTGLTLAVLLPSGVVEERGVVSQSGRTLTLASNYSSIPNNMGVYVLKSSTITAQTFRVIGVKEEEDATYTITCLRSDPSKFNFVENNVNLETKSYSNLTQAPAAPLNLLVTEGLYETSAGVRAKTTLSWDRVNLASAYRVTYKPDSGNLVELNETSNNEIEILDVQPGIYAFEVRSVNAIGIPSGPSTISKELFGKTAPPLDVTGFSMIPSAGVALLSWDRATDLDVLIGGFVRIRHTPAVTGQTWNNSTDIIPAVPGTANSAIAPLSTGTYLIKFVDSSGYVSVNEKLIVTTVPDAVALNVVNTITESPAFSGTFDTMTPGSILGANFITLTSSSLIDDLDYIDNLGNFEFSGNVSPQGYYYFATAVDLGGVWPSRIRSTVQIQAVNTGSFVDERRDMVDVWDDIDGGTVDDVNAALQVRTTSDNPSASPVWSDWKLITTAEYAARGFQFRLSCTSGSESHNLYVQTLQTVVDMEDRTLSGGPISSGTGTYSVTYGEGFFATPTLAITADSLSSGDFYTITSQSSTGFNIIFKNAGGTGVSRTFTYLAKGYGRKVA